jgi:SPP1 family predicted phage head-tail adaptor
MIRVNVLDLITVNPEAAGVGTEPTETKRTVYCTVKSIGQQEAYLAMGQGLNPELKVILSHDFEYKGERLCEMDGVRYDILRTYTTETDGIELVLQRAARNARPVPAPDAGTPGTSGTPGTQGTTETGTPGTAGTSSGAEGVG